MTERKKKSTEEEPQQTEEPVAVPEGALEAEPEPVGAIGEPIDGDTLYDPLSKPEPEKQADTSPALEGEVRVRYDGPSDLFEHGEYKFRPGEAANVPADVAEDLLTQPNHEFAVEE